jgi:hypothetical protein
MDSFEFIRQDWTHRVSETEIYFDEEEYLEYMNNDVPECKPAFGKYSNSRISSSHNYLVATVEELREPLLQMAEGLIDFNPTLFQENHKLIRIIQWMLSEKSVIDSERDFDSIYRTIEEKEEVRNNRFNKLKSEKSSLEWRLKRINQELEDYQDVIDSDELEKEKKYMDKHLHSGSRVNVILFKCLLSELWKRSPDEIDEFKDGVPNEISDFIDEIILKMKFNQ